MVVVAEEKGSIKGNAMNEVDFQRDHKAPGGIECEGRGSGKKGDEAAGEDQETEAGRWE